MLKDSLKNILCILLVICFLLQGCAKQQHVTPSPEAKQNPTSISQTIPDREKSTYAYENYSKKELEQEIKEVEQYFIDLKNPDPNKSPGEQLAQTIGTIFMPIALAAYFGAKVEYAKRYGTQEQKQILNNLDASSGDPVKQLGDLVKILDFHPAVYDTFNPQNQSYENILSDPEFKKKIEDDISENIKAELETLLK